MVPSSENLPLSMRLATRPATHPKYGLRPSVYGASSSKPSVISPGVPVASGANTEVMVAPKSMTLTLREPLLISHWLTGWPSLVVPKTMALLGGVHTLAHAESCEAGVLTREHALSTRREDNSTEHAAIRARYAEDSRLRPQATHLCASWAWRTLDGTGRKPTLAAASSSSGRSDKPGRSSRWLGGGGGAVDSGSDGGKRRQRFLLGQFLLMFLSLPIEVPVENLYLRSGSTRGLVHVGPTRC